MRFSLDLENVLHFFYSGECQLVYSWQNWGDFFTSSVVFVFMVTKQVDGTMNLNSRDINTWLMIMQNVYAMNEISFSYQ